MSFYFVSITRGGLATISDPTEKPRILCFKTEDAANKYVHYLSGYRSKFGLWPSVNLGQRLNKVRVKSEFKSRTPEYVQKFINITSKEKYDLDAISMATGISYFYCHDFEYDESNFMTINFRGQEIDGFVDQASYKDWLEYNLKNV